MADYLIVRMDVAIEMPEGWQKESDEETERRVADILTDANRGRLEGQFRLDDWWVTS